MPLLKSSGPFVIRISCDGKPDRYMKNQGALLMFESMVAGLEGCKSLRHTWSEGEYPAVVPLAAVPAEER